MTAARSPSTAAAVAHCQWCGAGLVNSGPVNRGTGNTGPREGGTGRPRRYCGQACRQRAYEQRNAVLRSGFAADTVIFGGAEFAELQDRIYQLRCAAEDIATAVTDGDPAEELGSLAAELVAAASKLERLR